MKNRTTQVIELKVSATNKQTCWLNISAKAHSKIKNSFQSQLVSVLSKSTYFQDYMHTKQLRPFKASENHFCMTKFAKNLVFKLKSLALAQSPKSKSKGEALGQSISLNLVYTHTTHTTPHTHKLLGHFRGI